MDKETLNQEDVRIFKKWQRKKLAAHCIAASVMVYALWRIIR